jgi:hypothetical protein
MGDKPIQEQFGDAIIDAVRNFARADIYNIPQIEQNFFSHVTDDRLRRTLAETLYGARWIYKLGLALLVQDEEQLAHVRCQVIDYGSVCEGLLHDAIRQALRAGVMKGQKHLFSDTTNLRYPIDWKTDVDSTLDRQSFYWQIEIAADENIVDANLATRLHTLRKDRNTVHLRARTYQAFINVSREAYQTFLDAVDQTRTWRRRHPKII